MIVLDASAVIEILLRPERHHPLLVRVLDPGQSLVAPHILDLEVAQVLRRYATGREISASRAEAAFEDYRGLRISRYPHTPLLSRIWALRNNCTAYDAASIALAEALACPLLTCDTALAVVPGHRATIDVMGR
jgi:predicted nucleic acid-binding protein